MILRCVVCLRENATGLDPSDPGTEYHLLYAKSADTIFNGHAVCFLHFSDPLVTGLMPEKPEPEPEPVPEPEPEPLPPPIDPKDDPSAPIEQACAEAIHAWADAMREEMVAVRTGNPQPISHERRREIEHNLQIVEATITYQKYLRHVSESEMREALHAHALATAESDYYKASVKKAKRDLGKATKGKKK